MSTTKLSLAALNADRMNALSAMLAAFRHQPTATVSTVLATWFGGSNDPDDNGETASTVFTRGNPWMLGCALPKVPTRATVNPAYRTTPWGALVVVQRVDTGATVLVPLIDNGPSDRNPSGAVIDLTVGTFAALGVPVVSDRPTRASLVVNFAVCGGEQFAGWSFYTGHYASR